MIPNSQAFSHELIEETVKVGDIVIDGTTSNGSNTRFLATRIGKSGQVISYTTTKDNANATAASLFMSGLLERVTLLSKNIDEQFITELGSNNQVSLAIFDYSEDAQNENNLPLDYLNQVNHVLPRLTHGGLLIIKFNHQPNSWHNFSDSLLSADYKQACYLTENITTYLIERI